MEFDFGKTVYIETSVASYLTAGTLTNPAKIARQLASRSWLDFWGPGFALFTSTPTIEAAKREHHEDAARGLEALDGIAKLPITNAVNTLADALILNRAIPPESRDDAVHIALAAVHDIDYILTWRLRLLDKGVTGPNIRQVCKQHRFRSPETCAPYALVGAVPVHSDEILEEIREIRYNNYHDEKLEAHHQARGEPLPPIDVPARLEEFKEVEDGWLDGEGIAPSHDGLDWLTGAVKSHFPAEETPTKCYLTRDARVRMEWSIGGTFMRLQIDLRLHTGGWQWSSSKSLEFKHGKLDLDEASSWEWWGSEVKGKRAQNGERRVTL